ncbi:DUF6126 family protein [Streptomyces sp. NPDC003470]|jgi:hypothetical protein|uniref:DUF6126 family protein n=1 Tax=Streptomyces flaveolus TaxID=67297 RepID=A0ABV1VLE3_9ACTN|nr:MULTISPECIES: DUF6126 family protein [Streptomyces]MCG8965588.1 small hydrophobic protein [Streptomyces sp. CL12-4]GGQ74823.1 hypothetical protein GCM10010216_40950 [Streptomyces flaveolus]
MSTIQDKLPRALWVRLLIYIALGHVVAGFLFLLFEVGAK